MRAQISSACARLFHPTMNCADFQRPFAVRRVRSGFATRMLKTRCGTPVHACRVSTERVFEFLSATVDPGATYLLGADVRSFADSAMIFSISSGLRGSFRLRSSEPLSVMSTSSSIRTPRFSSGI